MTGIKSIVVAHLLLPALDLLLFSTILVLVMSRVAGKYWLAASLFSLGFLYADMGTFTSWGMNGLARFQEGKGPLVTIVPLFAAALTCDWFIRRQRLSLLALALLHVCAIGLSANGLFVSPAASGFVALAFLCTDLRRHAVAAMKLVPTLIYPAVLAVSVVMFRLALPSEVTEPQQSYAAFRGVVGWSVPGLALLAAMPLLPIVPTESRARVAGVIYLPVVLFAVLNPVGWTIVSSLTGNLGFRIFWALPGVFIAGAVAVRLLEALLPHDKQFLLSWFGAVGLVAGVILNQLTAGVDQRVQWHVPDFRVPRNEYDEARRLAASTPRGCKALVPEKYAVWISGFDDGPYQVAVRSLYLIHYRFSEPADELSTRWQLFNLVNGNYGAVELPTVRALRSYEMSIGLLATEPSNPKVKQVEILASHLQLQRINDGDQQLIVWKGSCGMTSAR